MNKTIDTPPPPHTQRLKKKKKRTKKSSTPTGYWPLIKMLLTNSSRDVLPSWQKLPTLKFVFCASWGHRYVLPIPGSDSASLGSVRLQALREFSDRIRSEELEQCYRLSKNLYCKKNKSIENNVACSMAWITITNENVHKRSKMRTLDTVWHAQFPFIRNP